LTRQRPVHRFNRIIQAAIPAASSELNEVFPMTVGKVSDSDFEAEVLKAQGPVVVDFWAEWCGPCRMIAPALDEIAGAMGDKVKIVKLNVDESPKTASKYGVMSIPTLMIFKGGEMASRQVGAAPKAKLQQWITAAV
jgi:thioredoxin 1